MTRRRWTDADRESQALPACRDCHYCALGLRCPHAAPWEGETHAIALRWDESCRRMFDAKA
jgi:hypothetical protein